MSSFAAVNQAKDRGLDLVEIHAKSKPPVCKIMDYGKWKFETKKKEKQNRKKQNKILVKEIQLRPRTGAGDIKIKLNKAREFLNQGHKVKVNIRFFGREMAHKDLGFKLLQKVEKELASLATAEMPAKMERRALFTILAPLGMTKKGITKGKTTATVVKGETAAAKKSLVQTKPTEDQTGDQTEQTTETALATKPLEQTTEDQTEDQTGQTTETALATKPLEQTTEDQTEATTESNKQG